MAAAALDSLFDDPALRVGLSRPSRLADAKGSSLRSTHQSHRHHLDERASPLRVWGFRVCPTGLAPLALFPHSSKLFPIMATPLDPKDLVTFSLWFSFFPSLHSSPYVRIFYNDGVSSIALI